MLAFRRFPLRLVLPSVWFALWFLLTLWFSLTLFPEPVPQPKSEIQWQLPFGSSCSGGMILLYMCPLKPSLAERERVAIMYKPRHELDTLRQWHDIDFIGVPLADFINLQGTIETIKLQQVSANKSLGVRIRFHQRATYTSLLGVLDVMGIFNQKMYWLDVQHQPMTLYAVDYGDE